ncbi:putative Kynurenine/alpha-aminoadipate aminotransferase mitochondrial precursor [Danaus plexippus plexippus]|uniref:Kynurenine/alpha-aminoadipate aminotransferase mitochondrial n=1 Tax=Danaus plexippus plexippus TaxID=278856 RepID=A0A212FIU7_DANPL|nr:putative Kynurenine/alpha-aminoadipate aminotransferase mitochondrial precursor [Danaus plexippus plexippus]
MLNLLKKRTIICGLQRYSQDVKNLYKFFSEEENENQKYRTLDEKDYVRFLSKRALTQKPGPTRLLREGMPNEKTFPFTNLELTTRSGDRISIQGHQLDEALQYIPPRGQPGLRTELNNFQQELHRPPPLPRNLLVTTGGQHGIFLCVELLVDHGDPIICTEYAYTGLHYILKPYQVEYIGIKEDKDGLLPEELESVLNTRLKQGLKMPRVLFVVLTVSNPTGFLLSESRRRRIYEIACKYDLLIVEDELHRPPPLPRNLLVTTGGQHGIFLCVELLVDHGDPIICTEYAYTGLHYILKPYQVEYIGIKEDKDGLLPEELESVLNTRLKQGLKMPRVLFVVLTVSNPTGFLLSESRRRRIYEIACKYDLLIVEDEVYMFLNYTDTVIPSFLSLDTTGRVVRIDSISKVVSAGLRVGWLTGPEPLIRYTELALMSQMLHTCSLAQKIEGLIEWEDPAGGYFHWVKIRGLEDVRNMVFNTAFKHGLMLEPGHNFSYDTEKPSPYIRLTFTRMNLEQLDDNVNTIRDIIIEEKKRLNKQSVGK